MQQRQKLKLIWKQKLQYYKQVLINTLAFFKNDAIEKAFGIEMFIIFKNMSLLTIKIVFLTLLLLWKSITSLVRNGDFQSFIPFYPYYLDDYFLDYNLGDPSSWYLKPTFLCFALRSYYNPITTKGIHLACNNQNITVCQQITLQAGKQYKIEYSVYNPHYVSQMMVSMYLNDAYVTSLVIDSPSTFGSHKDYFIAPFSGNHQLCFNQSLVAIWELNDPGFHSQAGLIDNLTLVQVKNYSISFTIRIYEKNCQIILQGNIIYNQQISNYIRINYQITSGEKILNLFECLENESGFISIVISPKNSFNLRQLNFILNENMNNNVEYNLDLQLKKTNTNFHWLSNEPREFLKLVQTFAFQTYKSTVAITTFTKSSLCSYYHNSILYKQIYQQILQLQFSMAGVSNLVKSAFKFNFNPFQPYFETQKIPQMLHNQKDNQTWLGQYGFSSLILNNNIDNFMMLGLLVAKLLLFNKLTQCLNKNTYKNIKTNYFILFSVQFISMSPSFIISALARIQNSVSSIFQSIQKIGQLILLFSSFVFIAYYSIEYYNLRKNKKQCQLLPSDLIMFFTIPFFLFGFLSDPKIFLVINSCVFIWKFVLFLLTRHQRKLFQNIFGYFVNLAWIVHHVVFSIFYVLDQKIQSFQGLYRSGILIYLGFVAILTLILGNCFLTLKLAIQFIQTVIYFIQYIKLLCTRKPKQGNEGLKKGKQFFKQEQNKIEETSIQSSQNNSKKIEQIEYNNSSQSSQSNQNNSDIQNVYIKVEMARP